MSIRLTTAKGHPVVIRRPELIVSLAGFQRQDPETGEMRDRTAIAFENRDVVFVDGHADVIEAAIESWKTTPVGDVAVFTPTGAVDERGVDYGPMTGSWNPGSV